ncbi:MAG: hypothetical protein AAF950_14065 [Pseudomonadota bacterium]
MTEMTASRLMDILAAYGAEPLSWPEEERAAAEALLAAHPERFADAIAEARQMDDELGALPIVSLPDGLIESVIASAPIREVSSGASALVRPLWQIRLWAGGFATACLALGLAVGYMAPLQSTTDYDPFEEALTYALFDSDLYSLEDDIDG